jgi:hypothetical protein
VSGKIDLTFLDGRHPPPGTRRPAPDT